MKRKPFVSKAISLTMAMGLLFIQGPALGAGPLDVDAIRTAAVAAGLEPLGAVPVPGPDLTGVVKNTPAAKRALLRLGKALFWDQQIGSDGQSCGTCHFHAGADSRAKNQLNPNTKNVTPDTLFGNNAFAVPGFPDFGPNYTLLPEDFPFHQLADPEENNFNNRVVLKDTNDVTSSQGVFNADFEKVKQFGRPGDKGEPEPDPVFNVAGINTRRVEPRNTPTMINAVFNFANFWDGRAHNIFNGVSVVGPLDQTATILVNNWGTLTAERIAFPNSSLASQAVGPPLSKDEMSFEARSFPALGKKMIHRQPLRFQRVHPADSVLGPLSMAIVNKRGRVTGTTGLKTTYETLIKQAFEKKYWDSKTSITFNEDGTRNIGGTSDDPNAVYTQMEANFSLFFGLAVQAYEATLVSDKSPFDLFMEGDNGALSTEQLQGLLVFLNRTALRNVPEVNAAIAQAEEALEVTIGSGNCVSCHGGAEFTDASVRTVSEEPIEVEETPILVGGLLEVGADEALLDNGWANIGVRPTNDDLGRGGSEAGFPLSFTRQALAGLSFAPPLPEGDLPEKIQVDGAFKIAGLRNVELTGPYFHNGSQATLGQVLEFYDRQSDFGDLNIDNLDRNMAFINLHDVDEEPVVEFLLSLTDDRVRNEKAPFDHPQLFVPNGHPGDQIAIAAINPDISFQAADDLLNIPAVGKGGRPAAHLPPLGTFLNLPPVD